MQHFASLEKSFVLLTRYMSSSKRTKPQQDYQKVCWGQPPIVTNTFCEDLYVTRRFE